MSADEETSVAYLCLHLFLHLKRFGHIQSFLNRRSPIDTSQPIANLLELLDINTRPFCPVDPTEAREICNGHSVAHYPRSFRTSSSGVGSCAIVLALFLEAIFQDLVQPLRLSLVAVDTVLDFLRGVPVEMVCLSLYCSDFGIRYY